MECIEISRSVTLGTEASQVDSQVECIEISRSVTLWYRGQSGGVYRD